MLRPMSAQSKPHLSPHTAFLPIALSFACSRQTSLMRHVLLSILTALLIVAMTLSAMVILVRATLYVTAIESAVPRAGAIAAEILLGVVLLLGTVWLATHLAVLIFAPKTHPSEGGRLG
jgi:hypothetical protein